MTSRPVVIDTNVGIAANSQADVCQACELACIRCLRHVTENGHLLLDASGQIFAEYVRYLSLSGEPGVGDAFLRWVHDHQYDEKSCTLVPLTVNPSGDIVEFPEHDSLASFDPSDKKFAAVSASHPQEAPIHVAVDRGWVRHRDALAEVGIEVIFLCPEDIGLDAPED